MFCSNCNADLITNHLLEDTVIPHMSNKSRIISPKCTICNQPILLSDVNIIDENKKYY